VARLQNLTAALQYPELKRALIPAFIFFFFLLYPRRNSLPMCADFIRLPSSSSRSPVVLLEVSFRQNKLVYSADFRSCLSREEPIRAAAKSHERRAALLMELEDEVAGVVAKLKERGVQILVPFIIAGGDHFSNLMLTTCPSRYTLPSFPRSNTNVVGAAVSGSSCASTQ
jgi:hypothetical protein